MKYDSHLYVILLVDKLFRATSIHCPSFSWQVLCAMGVEAVAGIPAKKISEVLSPFGSLTGDSSGQHQSPQNGPGLIKLPFSKARRNG